ncbi:hypothetical protein TIFTF001_042172 [Ficus carica]|uniref:Uncharacterized protein n=1 Tax=Ficus carica TaxID=3494 RepID=A0AA87ZF48_FICCA|nr:hypothetical protein TIFTF001_042172 [Ficus carica]
MLRLSPPVSKFRLSGDNNGVEEEDASSTSAAPAAHWIKTSSQLLTRKKLSSKWALIFRSQRESWKRKE